LISKLEDRRFNERAPEIFYSIFLSHYKPSSCTYILAAEETAKPRRFLERKDINSRVT
jgi:hypothetical protein